MTVKEEDMEEEKTRGTEPQWDCLEECMLGKPVGPSELGPEPAPEPERKTKRSARQAFLEDWCGILQ